MKQTFKPVSSGKAVSNHHPLLNIATADKDKSLSSRSVRRSIVSLHTTSHRVHRASSTSLHATAPPFSMLSSIRLTPPPLRSLQKWSRPRCATRHTQTSSAGASVTVTSRVCSSFAPWALPILQRDFSLASSWFFPAHRAGGGSSCSRSFSWERRL